MSDLTLSIAFIRSFADSSDVVPATTSLAQFNDIVGLPGITPAIQGFQFATFLDAYLSVVEPIVLTGDLVGVNLLLDSRILPESQLADEQSQTQLVDFFTSFDPSQSIIMEWGE